MSPRDTIERMYVPDGDEGKGPRTSLPHITICDCVTEREGRPHVTIPRAEYEAYRKAAMAWMEDHSSCGDTDGERCDCRECAPNNKIYDALRAAGIQTEGE